jgi:hypothetical protein
VAWQHRMLKLPAMPIAAVTPIENRIRTKKLSALAPSIRIQSFSSFLHLPPRTSTHAGRSLEETRPSERSMIARRHRHAGLGRVAMSDNCILGFAWSQATQVEN